MKLVFLNNIFALVLGQSSAKASRKLNATKVETAAGAASTLLLPLPRPSRGEHEGCIAHKFTYSTAGEQKEN